MSIRPVNSFPAPTAMPEPEGLSTAFEEFSRRDGATESKQPREVLYGSQDLFKAWRTKEIETTTGLLQDFADEDGLFLVLLKKLGQSRNITAYQMGAGDEPFGVFRAKGDKVQSTPLIRPQYGEANQKIRSVFFSCMKLFKSTAGKVQGHEEYVFGDDFSRYTITKFDQVGIQRLIARTKAGSKDEENSATDLLNIMTAVNEEVCADLRLPGLAESSPSLRSCKLQFFIGTVHSKIGGQWLELTRHVAWIKQQKLGAIEPKAVDYFKKYGYITCIHTSPVVFDVLYAQCAKVMKRMIQTQCDTPESTKAFRRDLAVLDYRLFHAMPFYRGSASIIEVLRESLCNFQKQPVPQTTDIDALIQPFLVAYMHDPSRHPKSSEK